MIVLKALTEGVVLTLDDNDFHSLAAEILKRQSPGSCNTFDLVMENGQASLIIVQILNADDTDTTLLVRGHSVKSLF